MSAAVPAALSGPSTVQAKIVDAPKMFRDRGLHPRQTEPGVVSLKFAKSNTNVPLWDGDAATLQAPASTRNLNSMQRFQNSKPDASKNMGHFFVGGAPSNGASSGGESKKPVLMNCVDEMSNSRRGHPAEHKDLTALKPGIFVPSAEASPPNRFGKRPIENRDTHSRSEKEFAYHGKKQVVAGGGSVPTTASSLSATDIGGAQRSTDAVVAPVDLQHSKRFEASKRHSSNLNAGLQASSAAASQEFFDGKKKHVEPVPGNKSGQTLQYVFTAPSKNVDASYRPVAPFG